MLSDGFAFQRSIILIRYDQNSLGARDQVIWICCAVACILSIFLATRARLGLGGSCELDTRLGRQPPTSRERWFHHRMCVEGITVDKCPVNRRAPTDRIITKRRYITVSKEHITLKTRDHPLDGSMNICECDEGGLTCIHSVSNQRTYPVHGFYRVVVST